MSGLSTNGVNDGKLFIVPDSDSNMSDLVLSIRTIFALFHEKPFAIIFVCGCVRTVNSSS
jgi:hypothetical protein